MTLLVLYLKLYYILYYFFLTEQKVMEMEKRKMMKIQKQKEADQQRLLDELNKRQLFIIGKKSKYA